MVSHLKECQRGCVHLYGGCTWSVPGACVHDMKSNVGIYKHGVFRDDTLRASTKLVDQVHLYVPMYSE